MRKKYVLYDLIFPFWLMMFMPVFVFVTLLGNYLIDSIVLILALRYYHELRKGKELWFFITKAWFFGLLADLCAVLVLLFFTFQGDDHMYTIWDSPRTILEYLLAILIAGTLIVFFNYRNCRNACIPKETSWRIAFVMGILTAPWSFLLPTSLFVY
jgi:RsiW-degrading membrane proteinase PrsW (M82 family)